MLSWMPIWPMRSVHQALQSAIPPADPAVNALATDSKESCCLADIVTLLCLLYYTLTKLGYLSYTSHAEKVPPDIDFS